MRGTANGGRRSGRRLRLDKSDRAGQVTLSVNVATAVPRPATLPLTVTM